MNEDYTYDFFSEQREAEYEDFGKMSISDLRETLRLLIDRFGLSLVVSDNYILKYSKETNKLVDKSKTDTKPIRLENKK